MPAACVKADDPGVLFAGCGETTTGEKGHVLRTRDYGETWETFRFPTPANATMWGLATHPADANRLLAFSLFGEVYVSDDAGDSWRKIGREFGEIVPPPGYRTNDSEERCGCLWKCIGNSDTLLPQHRRECTPWDLLGWVCADSRPSLACGWPAPYVQAGRRLADAPHGQDGSYG